METSSAVLVDKEREKENIENENKDDSQTSTTTSDHQQQQEGDDDKVINQKTTTLSSRELLCKQVEQLVTDINDKRKRDGDLLENFKKKMESQITTSVEKLQMQLYLTYEKTDKVIEPKLKEFGEIIERIGQLEGELAEYKQTLIQLCKCLEGHPQDAEQ